MDISATSSTAQSHQEYIDSLLRPTLSQVCRISDVQKRKEQEINAKYHSQSDEHRAATSIQKAYRGHRERRQLQGLTLDPSSRWTEAIKEWRYRSATAPAEHFRLPLIETGVPRSANEPAQAKWRRAGQIAEHASGGESQHGIGGILDPQQGDASAPEVKTLLLDSRYFLEMVDGKHRYGANLQVYHEEWLRARTNSNFFWWLDSGAGKHLELPSCSRAKLDRERIRYLSKEERKEYLVDVDDSGSLRWAKDGELITTDADVFKDSMAGIVERGNDSVPSFQDEAVQRQLSVSRHAMERDVLLDLERDAPLGARDQPKSGQSDPDSDSEQSSDDAANKDHRKARHGHKIVSPATILNRLLRASVKPGTWIYVADPSGRLYVSIKSSGAFQHASFLSGARISSAGAISIENGRLTYLSPLSGHYRPTTASFRAFLRNLKAQGIDMSHLRVSHAYEVLMGMEYYGKAKHGVEKMSLWKRHEERGPRASRPTPEQKLHDAANVTPATSLVDDNFKRNRRRSTLTKLLDQLHVRRKNKEP